MVIYLSDLLLKTNDMTTITISSDLYERLKKAGRVAQKLAYRAVLEVVGQGRNTDIISWRKVDSDKDNVKIAIET